ncbi:MAG TPA: glycine betaine ABC transporter substrate-binding protein [Gemmatimonas sp.]|nr:glycine betaine ABC transporter substrate-binding protein [Gemmatimonas sp.]
MAAASRAVLLLVVACRVPALVAQSPTERVAGPAQAESSVPRRPIVVASKPFGESFLLAEMFAQLLERSGRRVERKPGLGATDVAFRALRSDAIDVYPEYTGTGLLAILADSVTPAMRADPRRAYTHVATTSLQRFGVVWLPPLGFQNGYAVAVRAETAQRYRLRTLSDLAASGASLTGGFTSDFIGRSDGWPGLQRAYGMTLAGVRPLAPAIKYEALAQGAVDVIDGYATDGLLAKYALVTLEDDRRFFPPYDAAAVVSRRLAREDPGALAVLATLSGRLTEVDMRAWNRAIEVDELPIPLVARRALASIGVGDAVATVAPTVRPDASFWSFFWARRMETLRLAGEHAVLVGAALLLALLVAIPLGLWLSSHPVVAEPVLQLFGVLQTVPSIALLVFMIPLLGIGVVPAIVALWAYALLPIARATYTSVRLADPDAVAAIAAMGATSSQQLWWVRLPLAAPVVLAGVRTAAVLTVGTATLGAFIGAGGLGEPIVTGLGLADARLVLSGAIPAAAMAIIVDALLGWVSARLAPAHLRPRDRSTAS